ncbi:HD-GYP domain-containing protein [Candidatus Latescibacterota bacterium]
MRLCAVKEIEENMIMGKSLYDAKGQLLLGAGYRLTKKIKSKIIKRGHNHIYIMEEGTDDVIPQDIISDQIRLLASSILIDKVEEIQKITQFEDMTHDKALKLLKDGHFKKINISSDMKNMVDEIIKDISTAGTKFMNTIMLKTKDTYFIDHAINSTVLAILIAQKYGFKRSEITRLALGTFLHDIGKITIEQLKDHDNPKKAKEYYLEHSTFGYLLLKDSPNISPVEAQIVNQHHEYQNGTGFPIGLFGQNLPPINIENRFTKGKIFRFAEICCVANAYDNMVMNPLNKKQMEPQDVLKELILESGKKYNMDIVKTLLEIVPAFPVGAFLKIINSSNSALVGSVGVVAKINEKYLNKPFIIITRDKYMKKVKPDIIDTSKLQDVKLKLIL